MHSMNKLWKKFKFSVFEQATDLMRGLLVTMPIDWCVTSAIISLLNFYTAKTMSFFLHLWAVPVISRSVTSLCFPPLIEKCKSAAAAATDKPLPHIPVHKAFLMDILRSRSVRLESAKPRSWLNMCAEYRTPRCTCCTQTGVFNRTAANAIRLFYLNRN